MPLDNIDDLFRGKLDGHETPPGDDLWARLQAQPAAEPAASVPPGPEAPRAERLDQLFQAHLSAHVTPPARELWERLEDEHLRPRKRRAAAWWPLAIAATIALLITAGGAGLWRGFPADQTGGAAVARQSGQKATAPTIVAARKAASNAAATNTAATDVASSTATNLVAPETAPTGADARGSVATNVATGAPESPISKVSPKKVETRATPALALASSASKARKLAERQSPRHQLGSTRQPDAATPSPSLVARPTAPAPARNSATDEPRLSPAPAPVVAQTTSPTPAAEIVPTGTIITVDVRNGASPAPRTIQTTLAEVTTAEEPAGRRGLGGRLLQQAGHLVRGERLSLAEATGLPENVTLRANIAGRRISKSIQL